MACVLVVDDDRLVREGTCALLQSRGYETLAARDGAEAISIFNEFDVDVILVDIFMPEHGGYEMILSLRATVPIVAMSGVQTKEFEPLSFARSIGARDTLKKPFGPDTLVTCLEQVLSPGLSDEDVEVVSSGDVRSQRLS